MTNNEIQTALHTVLIECMKLDEGTVIKDSDCLYLDLDMQSMDFAALMILIEEDFNIEILQEEMDGMQKVGDLVALISKKKTEQEVNAS